MQWSQYQSNCAVMLIYYLSERAHRLLFVINYYCHYQLNKHLVPSCEKAFYGWNAIWVLKQIDEAHNWDHCECYHFFNSFLVASSFASAVCVSIQFTRNNRTRTQTHEERKQQCKKRAKWKYDLNYYRHNFVFHSLFRIKNCFENCIHTIFHKFCSRNI